MDDRQAAQLARAGCARLGPARRALGGSRDVGPAVAFPEDTPAAAAFPRLRWAGVCGAVGAPQRRAPRSSRPRCQEGPGGHAVTHRRAARRHHDSTHSGINGPYTVGDLGASGALQPGARAGGPAPPGAAPDCRPRRPGAPLRGQTDTPVKRTAWSWTTAPPARTVRSTAASSGGRSERRETGAWPPGRPPAWRAARPAGGRLRPTRPHPRCPPKTPPVRAARPRGAHSNLREPARSA